MYVINRSFKEATEIIDKHKILLITGIPGIGKTTLANLITYRLLSNDFRLVYIDEKIREAEDLFDNDINSKQLFYFDDFLGSSYLEIINARNTEKSITDFIERVKSTKNKCLILTTRSTILNQARSRYEKLARVNLDSVKYEIEITNYNDFDKAKILYNHLYFNDLNDDFLESIFNDKNYWKIIKHENYNPRLIEYFTNKINISHLKATEYFDFIMENLNNPEEIWSSAFINQLNVEEKILLLTLLSFGRRTPKNDLEYAFEERINYEVTKHGFTRNINIFNISLKNLLDGYITNTYLSTFSRASYTDFINPSLKDYLISFLNRNNSEKWRLIESFAYIEQFLTVFRKRKDAKNNVIIENNEVIKFLEIANTRKLVSIYTKEKNKIDLKIALLNSNFLSDDIDSIVEKLTLSKLQEINWSQLENPTFYDLISVLNNIPKESALENYAKENWDIIIRKVVNVIDQDYEMDQLENLFTKFDLVLSDYEVEDESWFDTLHIAVDKIFESEAERLINNEQYEVFSQNDFLKLQEKVYDRYFDLSNVYLGRTDVEPIHNPFSEIDVDLLIEENLEASRDSDSNKIEWDNKIYELDDSTDRIDDMFSQFER